MPDRPDEYYVERLIGRIRLLIATSDGLRIRLRAPLGVATVRVQGDGFAPSSAELATAVESASLVIESRRNPVRKQNRTMGVMGMVSATTRPPRSFA